MSRRLSIGEAHEQVCEAMDPCHVRLLPTSESSVLGHRRAVVKSFDVGKVKGSFGPVTDFVDLEQEPGQSRRRMSSVVRSPSRVSKPHDTAVRRLANRSSS